jgi:carbon-monoxide dehydrogenase medium subunit
MSIHAHPELPEFDYIRPASVQEASRFLLDHPSEAMLLMGGTDLFVRMRDGAWRPKFVVDVKNLDGTGDLDFDPQAGLKIGAAVNMNRLIASEAVNQHYPLLAEACCSVASYQLRTRATVVGNICNASPAGDTIGACIAFGGTLLVNNAGGDRQEPLSDFFISPGRTKLCPGDIVTALHLPPPPHGAKGTYIKLGRNQLSDLSIVGITVLGWRDESTASGFRFRIILASVAPVPLVVHAAEELLSRNYIDPALLTEAARLAKESCTPIDDVRSSARYRSAMVRSLTEKALLSVWNQLDHS